jgi:hypothetical protein
MTLIVAPIGVRYYYGEKYYSGDIGDMRVEAFV